MLADLGGDLSPQTSIAYRHHSFLWVTVHMHMQHQATKGCSEVVGKAVVEHAAKDEIHGQLTGDLVDGEVLTVQAHFCKKVQLVPAGKISDMRRCSLTTPYYLTT